MSGVRRRLALDRRAVGTLSQEAAADTAAVTNSANEKMSLGARMGPNETPDERPRESARGCKLDELIARELRIGAGRGSLHRLLRLIRISSPDTSLRSLYQPY